MLSMTASKASGASLAAVVIAAIEANTGDFMARRVEYAVFSERQRAAWASVDGDAEAYDYVTAHFTAALRAPSEVAS